MYLRIGGKFFLGIVRYRQNKIRWRSNWKQFMNGKQAGLSVSEGVCLDNEKISESRKKGPYIQSERVKDIIINTTELIEKGYAYYCFCSKERLDGIKNQQKKPMVNSTLWRPL